MTDAMDDNSLVDRIERKNACRHFLGMYPDDRPSCARGWDVRKWASKCNGGSEIGIALGLPCTRRIEGSGKPLFDCPDLDRETNAEVQAQRDAMSKRMDALVKGMGAVGAIRERMVSEAKSHSVEDCPWCGEKNALQVSCAISVNDHIHCKCSACGEGFME